MEWPTWYAILSNNRIALETGYSVLGNWEAFLSQFPISFIKILGSIRSKGGEVFSLEGNSGRNSLFEQRWKPFIRTMTDENKSGWLSRSGSHFPVSFVNNLALTLINTPPVPSSLLLISLQDSSESHQTLSNKLLNTSNSSTNRK